MAIISFSPPAIICSSQRLLPSLPQYLFFFVVTVGCTSLFPCSLSLDAKYEYCQNNSKCGTLNIEYPYGVGNRGCGDPRFQVHCVQNSNFVIPIHGMNYTIHALLPPRTLVITRGQNCQFLDPSINKSIQSSQFERTGFTLTATEVLTVYVYKYKEQDHLHLSRCNASVSYSYEKDNSTSASPLEQLPVPAALIVPVLKDDESCTLCQESHGICGYNTAAQFVCYCKDGPCPRNKAIIIIVIDQSLHSTAGCFTGGAALTAGMFLVYYLNNRKLPDDVLPEHLSELEMGNLPIFSYEELRQITNCFHKENELGVGGSGSVYLGKLWGGRLVAVKRLYQDNSRRLEQFIHEVKIFSTLNHQHVVRLYGCTPLDSPELLLVYEFIPNGTLADHLHGDRRSPKGLPWNTRLKISIQTAETLAFLHALDPPILHRDVKTANILLDENSDIKLCDFGLCRIVPVDASHVTTIPQGTPGYVDPEYYQSYRLTEKSDVYSFGVVLLEIISAKQAMDINRNKGEINLANMAITKIQEGALHELVDPQLEIEVNQDMKTMVSAVAELAFRCVASERDDRPDMEEVAAQLEEIRHSRGS
eukprot:PITA_23786